MHERNEYAARELDLWLDGKNMSRLERLTGFGHTSIYEWRSGKRPLPCYVPAAVHHVFPNDAAMSRIMQLDVIGRRLVPVHRIGLVGDHRDEMMEAGEAIGNAMGEIRESFKDKSFSPDETRAICEKIDKAIQELEETKQSVLAHAQQVVACK